MKSLTKSNGVTLVEVLIAVGCSAVVMLGSLEVFRSMNKMEATSKQGQEETSLAYEIDRIISNEPVCTAALAGVESVNGTDVTLSPQVRGGVRYGKLTLTSLKLQNVSLITGPNYSADLELVGSKTDQVFGTPPIRKRSRLFYTVNAANRIETCLASGRTPASDCSAMGGAWTGTNCNFCSALGGTINPDGSCSIVGANIYGWQADSWGYCVNGTRTRVVECYDNNTSTVAPDANCTGTKPATSQSCSNYDWSVSAWSACSNNTKTRTVACTNTTGGTIVADSFCPAASRPSSSDSCGGGCVPVQRTANSNAYFNSPALAEDLTDDLIQDYPGKMPSQDETNARAAYHTIGDHCSTITTDCESVTTCSLIGAQGKVSYNLLQTIYQFCPQDCATPPCTQSQSFSSVTLCVEP